MSFREQLDQMIAEIPAKREKIKEEFIKTWLAHLPDEKLNLEWLIKNVELVEIFDRETMQYKWFLQMKEDPSKFDDHEHHRCAQCKGKGYITDLQHKLNLEGYYGV